MKRIYSVILLIAYLVGTIQPVMPMFKYELSQGNVIEYVLSEVVHNDGSMIAAHPVVKAKDDDSCKNCKKVLNLLRDSFYPVGVEIFTVYDPIPYANKKLLYFSAGIQTSDPTYFPNSPPPKLG